MAESATDLYLRIPKPKWEVIGAFRGPVSFPLVSPSCEATFDGKMLGGIEERGNATHRNWV